MLQVFLCLFVKRRVTMTGTFILAFLAFSSIASAETYFVAPPAANPAGNHNNSGTIQNLRSGNNSIYIL